MSATKVIVRPRKRTEVHDLPWRGSGAWYGLLREIIGAGKQVKHLGGGVFSVARAHTTELIQGLAEELGSVVVEQHGGATSCVAECWNANPDTAHTCECGCAGSNHGQGPPTKVVGGWLGIMPEAPRIYVVQHRG